MILDLQRFVGENQSLWEELDAFVRRLESQPAARLTVEEAKRFHYLYQRTSGDLARVMTFAAEPAIRGYLESLVGRAYGEVNRQPGGGTRWSPWRWFMYSFPQAFRRRARSFAFACLVTIVGAAFGAGALLVDPEAKAVLLPFGHGEMDPRDRVARDEAGGDEPGSGGHARFSAMLMTHNTKVAILTLALGMTWGFGTLVVLFYNGVILGAIVADYLVADQAVFLAGWLLPHGSVEIPAILFAGQAGLVLGGALIGWSSRDSLRQRLRAVAPDLATLLGGTAVILVWAGLIESFFSQYHAPVLPYSIKIAFGAIQLVVLAIFLARAGRSVETAAAEGTHR